MKGIGVGSEARCGGWGRALGFVDFGGFFRCWRFSWIFNLPQLFPPPLAKGAAIYVSDRDHCLYWGISWYFEYEMVSTKVMYSWQGLIFVR